MLRSSNTRAAILDQCARYPRLTAQDLCKFLHQSTFGCGHLVQNGDGFVALRAEADHSADKRCLELLDGEFCRVHLGSLRHGLRIETLWSAFLHSAEESCGTVEELESRLEVLLELSRNGALPCTAEEIETAVEQWRQAGYPAQHHSAAFRAAYTPTYRVIHRRFAALLPLLMAIDRKRKEDAPFFVALEGGSAAGKTTVAQLLHTLYGCPILHMDDFFLRPEQRTAERLTQPGGNVDRERFLFEVLSPLRSGRSALYRRYDCHTQTILPGQEITPAPLMVIEGAYSCHPALRQYYDLTCFLHSSSELQHRRIQKRNAPSMQERFFNEWIPMEQHYFQYFGISAACDLSLCADHPFDWMKEESKCL